MGEEPNAGETEIRVVGEEVDRDLVILGTRHHIKRNRLAVPPTEREHLLGVNLKEARRRNRADRIGSLRSFEAEPCARTSRDDHHRHLARGQRRRAQLGDVTSGDSFAVGSRKPNHVDGVHLAQVRDLTQVSFERFLDERIQHVEIDRGELLVQNLALALVEFRPPSQEVLLTVTFKSVDK